MGELTATAGAPLPAPLSGTGWRIASINRSDDQWVYISRELNSVDGVTPSTRYDVTIQARIATTLPTGCAGVGGSPDGIYLKGGVVSRAPMAVRESAARTSFNLMKGAQANVGSDAVLLGSGTVVGTGTNCGADNPGETITRMGRMRATSDATGRLWVYVGTDSAFEGGFTIWYRDVEVTLTPAM
jgi:hypothetical protein